MDNYSALMAAIIKKIKTLIEGYERMGVEKEQLKKENGTLQEKLKTQQQQIEKLEEELTVVKMTRAAANGEKNEETKELRKKVNQDIREIDKCLAMLHD